MISYNNLWNVMKEKGVSQYALIKKYNIIPAQITRIKRNESVSTHTIEIADLPLEDLIEKVRADKAAALILDKDLHLSPKTVAGISGEVHRHIEVFATDSVVQEALSCPEDKSKTPICWDDLEQEDIFIRIDQSRVSQWGAMMRLMLVQLMRALERRPEKYSPEGSGIKPALLLLDEFPQYGKIDVIPETMKILRSKNVTFSIFCQSLADLDATYGTAIRRTILDNCPYQAILNANDVETQKYFSQRVGTVRTLHRTVSQQTDVYGNVMGYGNSFSEVLEPTLFPESFGYLSYIVLLHPHAGGFCRIEKETYFQRHMLPPDYGRRG